MTESLVKTLQEKLSERGFDPGPIDGILGSKTKTAIILYQQSVGLVPDGIAGPKTWQSLGGKPLIGEHQDPATMSVSDAGVDFVRLKEGFFSYAYTDPIGVWTIGYGHTAGVQRGQHVTQLQAIALLRQDLSLAEKAVRSYVSVPLTQGQFDALVSFAFNVGNGALLHSTLLKKLNEGDYEGAKNEFPKWCHAAGRTLPGLVTRRRQEAEMFGG